MEDLFGQEDWFNLLTPQSPHSSALQVSQRLARKRGLGAELAVELGEYFVDGF